MEQILNVLSEIVLFLVSSFGYGGVFLAMVMESGCIPLPSEIILPFAGYLVFTGKFTFWKITLIASLANVVGGLAAYYLGKYGGRPFIRKYGRYLFMTEYKLKKTEVFFEKYGEPTVFFGRMLPVVRTFISLPAGIARMNPLKLSIYTFLGSLPWCALLIWAGYELGENWQAVKALFHRFHLVMGAGALVLMMMFILLYFLRRSKR